MRARVRTAVPLTHDERRTLSVKLAQALGARQAVLEEAVDVEAAARCWTEASRGRARPDTPSPREWLDGSAAARHRL